MKKIILILFSLLTFVSVDAQILYDNEAKQLIVKGLDKLYNYEYKEADILLQKVKAKYPTHPVTPLLNAVQLEWQYLDIEHNPKVIAQYKENLDQCVEWAEPLLDDKEKFPEAVFFLLSAHGYIALSHTFNKEYLKAGNEARKAYNYMKDGFKLLERNPEFYASTGMYNFYVEQYPESHPAVRPVMVFFAKGDKKLGLEQLDVATRKSLFSRVEAMYTLAHIYLKYEDLPAKALIYSNLLSTRYPNNLVFLMKYTESLLLTGKYEEAIPKIEILRKNPDKIYQLAANVFDGIIAEKYKKNDKLATSFYAASFKYTHDERYTKNYHAMAYLGLARIYTRQNDKGKAKEYYKKCLDIADYKGIVEEAKSSK